MTHAVRMGDEQGSFYGRYWSPLGLHCSSFRVLSTIQIGFDKEDQYSLSSQKEELRRQQISPAAAAAATAAHATYYIVLLPSI